MSVSFKGKTALITGGTSGIGRATAIALAKAGANVVITGRRAPEGERVLGEIKAAGAPKSAFVQGDVTDEAAVEKAVGAAIGLGDRLDLAFNNAGLELMGVNAADTTTEQYRKVFDVNVLGVILSMKHEIRAMLKSGGGSIVNNSSIAGSIAMGGLGVYVASKHAVIGLTKAAALEVAKSGIRVNAVSPAAIETEMFDRFTGGKTENVSYMASLHPIGRVGKPEEIADGVLFLLGGGSTFITGHDLRIDGGFTAQ